MEFPKGGLIGKTVHLLRRLQQMQLPQHAANAGYFIVLSVFPALVLLLSVLRYTPLDAADLLSLLRGFLPEALLPAAEKLIISTYAHTSKTMVSVSAIGVLWSASRGIYALLRGFNAIYDVSESRGYWYTRCMCVVYMFLFLLVLLLTLVAYLFGESLLQMLSASAAVVQILDQILDLRVILLLILQTALFTAMYVALPNRKASFRDNLPGALLASVGWLGFTDLFSYYVEHFAPLSSVYGSVYAVALGMLWLYFCLLIVFYGSALNRILKDMENM